MKFKFPKFKLPKMKLPKFHLPRMRSLSGQNLRHHGAKFWEMSVLPWLVILTVVAIMIWQVTITVQTIMPHESIGQKLLTSDSGGAPASSNFIQDMGSLHLFGDFQESLKNLPIANLGIKLHGVFVNSDTRKSRALIALTGQQAKSYKAGDHLPNGSLVYKIMPDSVIISDSGSLKKLELPIQPFVFPTQMTNEGLFD
tara:strand:- start:75931 stop:76524 length:594 start_codon:yes stop_codon:yes gene_type:complete